MDYTRKQNIDFKTQISQAVILLIGQGKKRSPINISRVSGYPLKEIELNLYEIGQIVDTIEDVNDAA